MPSLPMTFREAQARLEALLDRRQRGEIDGEAFADSVNELRVQDASRTWWQPDPQGEGWLRWENSQWRPGVPEELRPPVLRPSQRKAAHPLREKASPRPLPIARFRDFKSGLMDPQTFLNTARKTPLAERSQAWWDMFSILGGAASGYLWFLYGSVRGLSFNDGISNLLVRFLPFGLGSVVTSLVSHAPTVAFMALPILIFLGRRALIEKSQSLWLKVRDLPPRPKILVGVASGIITWILLAKKFFVFQNREGLDFVTPVLMSGLPILLAWFRSDIDKLFMPMHPVRKKIPRPILLGMGLAIPFLTAFVLTRRFGIIQYPLLRWNVVVGTVLSYVVLRTPQGQEEQASGAPGMAKALSLFFGIMLLGASSGFADDFLRDPFNLNDGLRTNGWAEVLAGAATAVVVMVVNGQQVTQVILQGPSQTKPGQKPQRKNFAVKVDVVDAQAVTSTTLKSDPGEALFAYAHCEETGKGRFPQGDSTIKFSLLSGQDWVQLEDLGTQHGRRCCRLAFVSPLPLGDPPETIPLRVTAGAEPLIGYDIPITLELGLVLSAEVENGERKSGAQSAFPVFTVRYDRQGKAWRFGELRLFFHPAGSQGPVRPPFEPLWSPIKASPDDLEFGPIASSDGNLTWRCQVQLKPGTTLPDDWVHKDGQFTLTVSCTEKT